MKEILRLFPETLSAQINLQIAGRWHYLQEIRFRFNQPIELIFDHQVEWDNNIKPNQKDKMHIINQLSDFSLYRMEDELREGYITIEGGHRVDRKSTRLNSSHVSISYAVFCLKKTKE